MNPVENFFELDDQKTFNVLEQLSYKSTLMQAFDPNHARNWNTNPLHQIVKNDAMWDAWVSTWKAITGKKLTLSDWFRSLAICQAFVMKHNNGPEHDGARLMLRGHWYNWTKMGMQDAALRLGICLLPNGTPYDDELYALMSVCLGKWNEDGLVEYRQFYILNDSTKMCVFEDSLPAPFDCVMVCCEKDTAFPGVCLSAKAAGFKFVYSGSGKSAKSGIERIYYQALKKALEGGSQLYVIAASDWDYDGKEVIAPTFAAQLETYIPKERITWVRAGITPAQVEQIKGDWESSEYLLKWNVAGGLMSYLQWSKDNAVIHFKCQSCGESAYTIGTVCPFCHSDQIQLIASDLVDYDALDALVSGNIEGLDKETIKALKESYIEFFENNTPKGFELEALTRVQQCQLLIDGFLEMIEWDELVDALSTEEAPSKWDVIYGVIRNLVSENESYVELLRYQRELRAWFDEQVQGLADLQRKIEKEAREVAETMTAEAKQLSAAYVESEPEPNDLIGYMQSARFQNGRCTSCGTDISQCSNPENHARWGYHTIADESKDVGEMVAHIARWRPFNREERNARWQDAVEYVMNEMADEFKGRQYTYERLTNVGDNEAE